MKIVTKIIRVILKLIMVITAMGVVIYLIVSSSQKENFSYFNFFFILISLALTILGAVALLSNPTFKIPRIKSNLKKASKVKITEEFKYLYKELEELYGKELEKLRKRTLKYIKIMLLYMIITFGSIIIIYPIIQIELKLLFFIMIPIPIYCVWKYEKNSKIYKEEFKKVIIKQFVKTINSNLIYHYEGNDELCDYYEKGNFEAEDFNTYETTDYIGGRIDKNISIELCNIALHNYKGKERINTVDKMLFSYNEYKNYMPTELRIKKNKYKIVNDKDRVELDDKEFEKYFDVNCHSKIVAMQVLTHDVMQEIVGFYLLYKIQMEIVLRENKIYIKYDTGTMLNPKVLKQSMNIQLLWFYYNTIEFAINITTRVNKLLNNVEI